MEHLAEVVLEDRRLLVTASFLLGAGEGLEVEREGLIEATLGPVELRQICERDRQVRVGRGIELPGQRDALLCERLGLVELPGKALGGRSAGQQMRSDSRVDPHRRPR